MLDNALPAGGYVYVSAPSALTLANGGCSCWALGDDLTPPAAGSTSWISGSLTASSGVCTMYGALSAGTAYGMTVSASMSAAGSAAPIGL